MRSIVLATGNAGKIEEIRHMLAATDIDVLPQSELGVPEVEETGLSFIENALLKARNATRCTGLPAIADDSGLEVDALHGAPGIFSSRYAGPQASDQENLQKLLVDLARVTETQRTARFQCVIVYVRHTLDPTPVVCQGTWEGRILHVPRGTHGFGYDPIFYVPTHDCTSAELPQEIKNRLSHRGQALHALTQHLQTLC